MVANYDATVGSLAGRVRLDVNDTRGTDCCLHRLCVHSIRDSGAGTVIPSLRDWWILLN